MGIPQRLGPWLADQDAAVEVLHQLPGLFVGHLPKAHDKRFRPGQHEGASQAEDPLAGADFAQAGVARRKDHQFGVQQVHAGHVFGREQTVLGLWRQVAFPEPRVPSGQDQTGTKQRVFELQP